MQGVQSSIEVDKEIDLTVESKVVQEEQSEVRIRELWNVRVEEYVLSREALTILQQGIEKFHALPKENQVPFEQQYTMATREEVEQYLQSLLLSNFRRKLRKLNLVALSEIVSINDSEE